MKLKRPFVFGSILVLAVAAVSAWGSYDFGYRRAAAHYVDLFSRVTPIRDKSVSYQFARPLLAYSIPEATNLGKYANLKSIFTNEIAKAKSGAITRASIYFRDLDTSNWLGINQNDTYYPASLLKVPAMIAYYKEAENDPSILDQSVTYDPSVLPQEPFEATSLLVAGQSYSMQELIKSMIRDSDNGATFTLLAQTNPQFLHEVYIALGVQDPGDDSLNYQISTRTYALFFRILYNATYLSPQYSDKALKLLSQATFDQGLVAGVPSGTIVSHKYGEHVIADAAGKQAGVELHDCGIVYYPAHPYLLCVMTSSSDLDSAEHLIATVSAEAYAAVNTQYATSTPQI